MRGVTPLIILCLKQMLRARRFLAGTMIFYGVVLSAPFLLSDRGQPEDALKFYVSVAWTLVFLFVLGVMVFLPLIFFARERESRIGLLMGTRPVTRFGFLAARLLASWFIGFVLLAAGMFSLWAGTQVLSWRTGADLAALSGCRVKPAPPAVVSGMAVKALVRELGRDRDFVARHGEAGVQRIARRNLSTIRLKENEQTRVTWSRPFPLDGHDGQAARLQYVPSIYPPWGDVSLAFHVAGETITRFVDPGCPGHIPIPRDALNPEGDLAVDVRAVSASPVLVYFLLNQGLSLFVPMASFGENLVRASCLLFMFMAAMTVFSLFSGALFSFPVGMLAAVLLMLVGLSYPFLVASVAAFPEMTDHDHHAHGEDQEAGGPSIPAPVRVAWQRTLLGVLMVMPNPGDDNPLNALTEGRLLTWSAVGAAALRELVARSGVVLLLAWFFFSRQELGRRR